MKIPLLDINRQVAPIRAEIDKAIAKVVDGCRFILGPDVAELERNIAEYCGTEFAIGVASGTDALIIALHALGVGPGDEVITTPYSFFATASAIWRLGAKPVFVDIDPGTFNIDPQKVSEKITPRVKAVLAVHLFGQPADMDSLKSVCGDLPIVEDAAQAIGAKWNGVSAGNLGICGCFSFFPSKNLGGFGDGGMIVTSDENLKNKASALRVHGALKTYFHDAVGYNSRLDTLQAAILNVKLPYLQSWSAARRKNAAMYNKLFENTGVVTPEIHPSAETIYNQYVVRVPKRDALREKLNALDIGHSVYYPLPLHLQPCFQSLGYQRGDFPAAELAAQESIALPIFSELTQTEIETVAGAVIEHVRSS